MLKKYYNSTTHEPSMIISFNMTKQDKKLICLCGTVDADSNPSYFVSGREAQKANEMWNQ